jgi:hypothetical protein
MFRKGVEERSIASLWQIADATQSRYEAGKEFATELANVGSHIYSDSNREIASIYDPAKLQIWVDVNQRDVARLRVGQSGGSHSRCGARQGFTGEVSRILPRASLSKNTIQAKIILNEVTSNFRPDMSVKVTFLEEGATSAADKTVSSR